MRRLYCAEQNAIARLGSFLDHWDARAGRQLDVADHDHAPRSRYGNINVGAQPRSAPSLLVPRCHEDFYRYVEPGVREWVSWFVSRGYTTYTSCAGHYYGGAKEPDFRHVGLLIRQASERQRLMAAYERVVLPADCGCELAYLDHDVSSEGRRHDTIDVFLVPRGDTREDRYFGAVDAAMDLLLAQLERV